MKNFWKSFCNFFLNLFFPDDIKCLLCERDVEKGAILCEDCLENAPFNTGKRCRICDMPISGDSEVCDFCQSQHKLFDKAVSPFLYQGSVRNAIIKLKSRSAKYLAPGMAKLMAQRLKEANLDVDVVVPVPLSAKSLKKRGYNQSLLLAEEIAKILGKPLEKDVLVKTRETLHQKELTFADRQQNLKGAFSIRDRKLLKDKVVLLVDDIMTTGATANECARVVKRYAKNVFVSTFARNVYKNQKN